MAYFSTNSKDYIDKINALVKPEYTSQYDGTINGLIDKITNKEAFTYDFNADPLYQNYKDNYVKLGNEAAMNAAAAVSTQTGGYGNSYAATAASQANQQYLTQLNNVIPQLYDAALSKYRMEQEDLYNQYSTVASEENRLYGQYRDTVSDYYNDYGNLASGYSTALSQENWEKEYQLSLDKLNASKSSSSGGGTSTNSVGTPNASYAKEFNNALQIIIDGQGTKSALEYINSTNLPQEQKETMKKKVTNVVSNANNKKNAYSGRQNLNQAK